MAILDYELWPNGSVVGPNFPSPPVLQEPPERADMPPPWDPMLLHHRQLFPFLPLVGLLDSYSNHKQLVWGSMGG